VIQRTHTEGMELW